jgi:hypothetical protein
VIVWSAPAHAIRLSNSAVTECDQQKGSYSTDNRGSGAVQRPLEGRATHRPVGVVRPRLAVSRRYRGRDAPGGRLCRGRVPLLLGRGSAQRSSWRESSSPCANAATQVRVPPYRTRPHSVDLPDVGPPCGLFRIGGAHQGGKLGKQANSAKSTVIASLCGRSALWAGGKGVQGMGLRAAGGASFEGDMPAVWWPSPPPPCSLFLLVFASSFVCVVCRVWEWSADTWSRNACRTGHGGGAGADAWRRRASSVGREGGWRMRRGRRPAKP